MSDTVVLIHGAYMTPASWQSFKRLYEGRGYRVISPSWPYLDRSVEEIRANPGEPFAHLGFPDLVSHYETMVRELSDRPILVGHSFGGLIVQVLLDRGLGAAGVAIDSAPPRGVLPGPKAIRANSHVLLTWGAWHKAVSLTFKAFAWSWVHTLPQDEQRHAYERYVVPAPGKIFLQAAVGAGTRVNFRNGHRAPLFLIAGELDRTVTPGMNRRNFQKYRSTPARTDFTEFPGRTHWLIAGPGWEEIAEAAIGWAEQVGSGA